MDVLQLIALGGLALVGLAFLAVGRAGTGAGIEAAAWPLFALLALVAFSALVWPAPFTPVAEGVLRISGIDDRLRAVDAAIDSTLRLEELSAIGARSRDMLGRLRDFFGPDEAEAPSDTAAGPVPETEQGPGVVEAALRPLLVDTLALVIRALALAGSAAGLLALVALRAAARAARSAGGQRARVEALEARLTALESKLDAPGGRRLD